MQLHRQPVSVHVIEPGECKFLDIDKRKEKFQEGFKRYTKEELKEKEDKNEIEIS